MDPSIIDPLAFLEIFKSSQLFKTAIASSVGAMTGKQLHAEVIVSMEAGCARQLDVSYDGKASVSPGVTQGKSSSPTVLQR